LDDGAQRGHANARVRAEQPEAQAPCKMGCKGFHQRGQVVVPGDDQALRQHAGVLGVVRGHATPKEQQFMAVERGAHLVPAPPR